VGAWSSRPESEGCEFDPRGGLVLDFFRFLSRPLQLQEFFKGAAASHKHTY
jgi:hypothetical protein